MNESSGAPKGEEAESPSWGVLVLNQTIGLATVLALLILFLPSGTGARVLARFPALHRAAETLLEGLAAPGAVDVLAGIAAGALMIGWNVLHQTVLARRGDFGRGEPRIRAGVERAAAAYLVAATAFNEEIIFRGWLFSLVAARFGPAAALAGTSVLFALVHTEKGMHGRVTVFVYGLVLGGLWMLTGSLWSCVLAHAVLNAVAFFRPSRAAGNRGERPA